MGENLKELSEKGGVDIIVIPPVEEFKKMVLENSELKERVEYLEGEVRTLKRIYTEESKTIGKIRKYARNRLKEVNMDVYTHEVAGELIQILEGREEEYLLNFIKED